MIHLRSIMSQNMDDIKDYYTTDDSDSAMTENVENLRRKKKKKRFSEDQIRSLERIFENETTRLEPRKKVQLARELGLHPRQIAIWFQNRRARWKSKQMERDFGKLRAEYEALHLSFEALKQEKQALLKQLHKLSSSLEKQTETQTVQDPSSTSTSEHCDLENPHRKTEPREMAFTREFTLFSETDDQYEKIIDENNVAAIDGDEYNCFDPSGITDGLDGSCGTVDQSAQWWELWS